MRIAIIGSGIAGLTSAYFLRQHDCEVFEAKPFIGLAGHGLKLENGNVIDIPLRVIHPEYYPNLFSLCEEIGVSLRKLEHSGSFALSQVPDSFEYFSIPVFKNRYNFIKLNWGHLKIGAEFMRFYYYCHRFKNKIDFEHLSYGDFLEKYKISKNLSQMILYPLLSSICTCTYRELDLFPAKLLLEMMSMIAGPVPMERFYAGTHDIENALSQHIEKVHLSTRVDKVIIKDNGGQLIIKGKTQAFDHVVLATEAHFIRNYLEINEHTESMLEDLNRVPYKTTDTIIHTVRKDHPQVRSQKSLHYQEHPYGGQAQASMWLNKVEPHLSLSEQTMQTWNPYSDNVENELQRSPLNRALVTIESYQAVKRLQKFEHPSFSIAGSYLARGVPLLEGGVESALKLSQRLNKK